jgi:hypothetical protein
MSNIKFLFIINIIVCIISLIFFIESFSERGILLPILLENGPWVLLLWYLLSCVLSSLSGINAYTVQKKYNWIWLTGFSVGIGALSSCIFCILSIILFIFMSILQNASSEYYLDLLINIPAFLLIILSLICLFDILLIRKNYTYFKISQVVFGINCLSNLIILRSIDLYCPYQTWL